MIRTLRLSATAVLAFALVSLAVSPSSALALPVLSTAPPAYVASGAVVTLRGTTTDVAAGVTMQLERQDAATGAWTAVSDTTATTDAAGGWSLHTTLVRGGTFRVTQLAGAEAGSTTPFSTLAVPKLAPGSLRGGTPMPFERARVRFVVLPRTWTGGVATVRLSLGGRQVAVRRVQVVNGVATSVLPTNGVGAYRASLELPAADGFAQVRGGAVSYAVRGTRVGSGASAAWNTSLRAALRYRGIWTPGGRRFDSHMSDAVIAFHKAYGRPRTSTFEARDWALLTQRAITVRDTSRGLHIEIDKGRQILMQVRDGKPVFVIHVSTGATGNTPTGWFRVRWKGNWVPSNYGSLLYKSMSFVGGFAIHGYPSVPTTPASHGCVRVPMWIAATLYARTPVGTRILLYEGPGSTNVSVGKHRQHDVPELAGIA